VNVPGNAGRAPFASWDSESGQWLDAFGTSGDLFGQSEPFSGRWPTSGSMHRGSLYPRLTSAPPTSASASSSSPGLLPTPSASQFNDGESLESWEARNKRLKESWSSEKHPNGNGNGMGTPLPIAIKQPLKTPTAQLAVNGGSQHPDKRREGGHGPTLADQIEHLLPTPRATGGPSLPSAVLLPTPDATHGRKTTRTSLLLPGLVEQLLPTPTAMDSHGARNATATRSAVKPATNNDGWTLCDVFWTGELTGRPSRDGEAVTGRPAPRPTEPGRTGERLSPAFVEWMMGLPAGWVTDVPGLSRNAQLKALGNGVVPQQAAMALRMLLGAIEAGEAA
jgi:hypothetical protein